MSKQREDMVALRERTFERLEQQRRIGNYSAGAEDIRENTEALLKLIDNALGKMKHGPSQ